MKQWEVWFANFPFDDDPSIIKKRPVVILDVEPIRVLSIKVTTHDIRDVDPYDTPILNWQAAGLDRPSIARVSKTIYLTPENIIHKIGVLHFDDQNAILNKYVDFAGNGS
jgi:hypothetical protein